MHPDLTIRQEVKEILDVLDQAAAVKTPVEGDVWEVTHVYKNGNAEIRCGDKTRDLRPGYDRVAMFDSAGNPIREIGRTIRMGVKLRLQIEKDKVLSARIVD
jgi:hypothetical protein